MFGSQTHVKLVLVVKRFLDYSNQGLFEFLFLFFLQLAFVVVVVVVVVMMKFILFSIINTLLITLLLFVVEMNFFQD